MVSYLTSTQTVEDRRKKTSTFHRQAAELWQIDPRPQSTGEVYPYIVIDVKHTTGLACAVVRNQHHVIGWGYGQRENSELWQHVLAPLAPPGAVVCDGQKGILKAVNYLWSGIVIQRCLVHVERNIHTKLTRHPQTVAGQDLSWLLTQIWQVKTDIDMAIFIAIFEYLYYVHKSFISQRTLNSDTEAKKKWWYTHGRVRSAYRQLTLLIIDDQMFAFITHPELQLPATSNGLEGGINSRLAELLLRHRGMKPDHQKRVVDWYLDSRTEQSYLTRNSTRNGH